MKTISLTVWKKQAEIIARELGLKMVGDETDVNTKIIFKLLPAEGRRKVGIKFDI